MTVKAIGFVAVDDDEEQTVRGRLPIQAGSLVDRAKLGATARIVRNACLTFNYAATPTGSSEITIRITGLGRCSRTPFIQPPLLVERVEPEYPESLQERGIKGVVELSSMIGLDGMIRDVEIVSGDPELAQAAIKAMSQWRFRPALADDQPTEARRTFKLSFGVPVLIAR